MEKSRSPAIKNYHELGLETTARAKSMPEMTLKREVLGWLIMARSGHGHLQTFMRHLDTKKRTYCKCGQRRSKSYPFSYPSARPFRVKLFSVTDRRLLTKNEVLGTAQVIKIFS